MWLRAGSPVAGVSGAVVPAADAAAGVGLALVCVSVAEAGSTSREAPVARQTAVTLPAIPPREAGALSRQLIAEGALRALGVTGARCRRHKTQDTFYWWFRAMGSASSVQTGSQSSDLCSRWARNGRWTGRTCRSSSRPRWGGTGTGRRLGHTRC